ncbi:MAG TPA: tryptophan 2,3-dioxygenase family protein [Gemmataceae bacterium]|nr:tryptophan 2,3-dioxygenase family protein [Gemmataceae bacterium]
MSNPIPTYWDYLKLLPLLNLQSGLESDDARLSEDELHFIVVHQVFELWLKLVLRELRMARDQMAAEWVPEKHLPNVVRHLRRVNEIIRLSVSSFAVLETLTPQDFLAFRAKLGESSGFQSFQMRELELVLGLEPAERKQQEQIDPVPALERVAEATPEGKVIADILMRAQSEPSLRSALLGWLYRTPIEGSLPAMTTDRQTVAAFLAEYRSALSAYDQRLLSEFDDFASGPDAGKDESYRRLRARAALLFIESYRDLPLLSWPYLLLETVVELEELLVLWRMRHVRMVERMIGRRTGTGGSPGVAYLERTTQYRIFHEFWTVRTLLLPRDRVPPLRERRYYELMEDELHA